MGKYFTIEELTYSYTAEQRKIDNTPNEAQLKNLNELIVALDKIREHIGKPLIISSGFRSKKLNDIVKGSKTSSHLIGSAADMICKEMNAETLYEKIKEYLIDSEMMFDQLIIEKSKTDEWVHFGLKRYDGSQRRQFVCIELE